MKNKRLFSFIIVIIMLFSVCTALPMKISVPLETSASGIDNIAARADYLYNITWTAQTTVKGWRNNYTFNQGNTYHIPYGQPVTKGKYICWGVSVDDFLVATQNASSIFYTSRSVYNSKESTYYSMDCSALASYCWNLPSRTTTAGWANLDITDYGKCTSTNVNKIQKGDALNYYGGPNANNHVVIVSDVTYDSSGNVTQVEITEQTPPETKRSYYTASSLASKYSSYTIYRYNKRDSVTPPPNVPEPISKWYDDLTPVNLGDDFYAQMICQDNNCYLSNIDGNVSGAAPIATKNQIWHFVKQSDASYAILSYYDDLSMDVYAASTENATNIQMMPYVGNTAQKFWIYSINGAYYFRPQCTEYPFTINRQNNDNLEVWYFDPTFTNKRFDIIKMDLDGNMPISIGGDFYAQMVCEDGGCYLSNMEGNVGGADPIGTKNQIWHFKWLNDGSYTITSYYDGLSMDVAGAKTDNATNMQMMPYVGNTAQKFWIYSINGAYYIRSQCNPYPFTINRQNNDNLELWYYDATFSNKRFDIIKMDCGGNLPINVEGSFNGDFYGKIKCNMNGKYLTNIDNNVECAKDTYDNDQIWHFKWQHDVSYSITSYIDEKSMDIYCAKQENGTNVQMMPYVGNTAQRFWIYNMNDAYYIQPLCSALPFTINGENLEIWIYDKTFENKKFDIIEVIPKSKIEGDCNNDGEFNVADAVLLQKWLLAEPDTELVNWKAADLCEDNRIDVFDMIEMRKLIISSKSVQ